MGLSRSFALPVLRTVLIRRAEFHESPFPLSTRVSSVAAKSGRESFRMAPFHSVS